MSSPLPTVAFREGASDRVIKGDLTAIRNHFYVAHPWQIWLDPESAVLSGATLSSTNGWPYLAFANSGTPLAGWSHHVPTYWDSGNLTFKAFYTVSTGTAEQFRIIFTYQGAVDGVDISTGTDLNSEETVSFAGTGATYMDSYTATSSATITEGDTIFRVAISRDSADVLDTSTSDFRLHGVLLTFAATLT